MQQAGQAEPFLNEQLTLKGVEWLRGFRFRVYPMGGLLIVGGTGRWCEDLTRARTARR